VTGRREDVPAALAGERLDRVVAMATDLTRAQVQRLVVGSRVRVDGAIETRPGRRLTTGQVLEIESEEATEDPGGPAGDPTVEFAVVHEDDWLVVVDKPAGLVVHPGAGRPAATLVNGLVARYPEMAGVGQADRPGIVHRLDKGTSGLMVAARTAAAYEALVEMMAGRQVSRRYLTLVEGAPASERGVVDAPVGRSSRQPTRMAVSAGGRQARTSYVVRQRFPESDATLLECSLETGRTHQIRVHLSAIGHPVIGDPQYRRSSHPSPRLHLGRPFLHAFALGFEHPDGSGPREFSSELAGDLQSYLSRLS
jgi:23S rRNA pseudouridine1911/1915/1917 synthase